jgi:16S rRNA pseudouridine516 synthase
MQLQDILYSQGFGTRRVCAGLVQQGLVEVYMENEAPAPVLCVDSAMDFEAEGLRFRVQGVDWPYQRQAYVLLHKPAGTECSQKPSTTTGLLLLSDDGQFIHRMTSPKKHVPKVYEVTTKHPLDETQVARLLAGVVLDDSPKPVRAAACEAIDSHHLRLTLTEGKYHQVKRMLAAVSNRVEGLHRSQQGGFALPADLLPGQWRWLSADDLAQLSALA